MFKKRNGAQGERNKVQKTRKLQEIGLHTAKLRFTPDQLNNLNYIFAQKLKTRSSTKDNSLVVARSVSERLVQRLVCCAGALDPRFASKFLVKCDENEDFATSLAYIVRLDALSTPALYPDDVAPKFAIIENDPDYPAAYARMRLQGATLKTWNDCANTTGYLRRDKVQAKFVGLLAEAAASDFPTSPLAVDESTLCGTPGKIVAANTLAHILKTPTTTHVFYGPNGPLPRFPDPRDFRLAIVDEPTGIRLKIEFLSPSLANFSVDVRLLVAIGVDLWPSSTDFPARITIGHTDALLYHQAAQTGVYLVGFGVQSSAWQMRTLAAQALIMNHYGPNSTIHTILDVLCTLLLEIDENRSNKNHFSYKILTKYMFLTLLLRTLEEHSSTPSSDLLDYSPMYLSTHVLKILDKTISNLQIENLPNYFFKKSNLLVNPGHLCDDDYLIEANNIKMCLIRLFDEALVSNRASDDFERFSRAQESETVLLYKWKELVESLAPPSGTRGRRFCFAGATNSREVAHTAYTQRQLEYIGLLLENLLAVKQKILSSDSFNTEEDATKVDNTDNHQSHLEDVIYLLVTIMDQARDQYLLTQTNAHIIKNKAKIRSQFNSCTTKLVEIIRRDKESFIAIEDNLQLVKVILKWLYKAMDHNRRSLGPILRPYLATLFTSSHSISWHLDFIKQRLSTEEGDACGEFARLVNAGRISPAEGLIDAVRKKWDWAQDMMEMVEKGTLRVVFVGGRGQVLRHILSLPRYDKEKEMGTGAGYTLPSGRDYFATILSKSGRKSKVYLDETVPEHEILKNASPLTLIANDIHRRGEHRGYGDILKSLQSMQKLNMFHQVTSNLAKEERDQIGELIRSMEALKSRKSAAKRWSNTLPQSRKVGEKCEKYTRREEGATQEAFSAPPAAATLLGSCRAARIREDNSVFLLRDSFRLQNLLRTESFKF